MLVVLSLLSCKENVKGKAAILLVAAASNVQFVLEDLLVDFEERYGIKCQAIVSSSGKLSSQIISGADFDIFISADQYYPDFIFKAGLGESKPEPYARGKLIYWTTRFALDSMNFNIVDQRFRKIAIANPKLAPYGKAAEQALEKQGVKARIEDRFVYGENISQVNQFISLGAADIGLTSQSIVYAKKGGAKGTWVEVDEAYYEPILQDAILLKNGRATKTNRRLFLDYLLSEKGQNILGSYGYAPAKQ